MDAPFLDRRGKLGPPEELAPEAFAGHQRPLGDSAADANLKLRRRFLRVIVHGAG